MRRKVTACTSRFCKLWSSLGCWKEVHRNASPPCYAGQESRRDSRPWIAHEAKQGQTEGCLARPNELIELVRASCCHTAPLPSSGGDRPRSEGAPFLAETSWPPSLGLRS